MNGNPPHLLIIDDEIGMLSLLSELLISEGYRVTTSQSAMEGWRILESQKIEFDLILSDFNMAQLNGIGLLKKINQLKSKIPFILMTAFGNLETEEEALRCGAFSYIAKPFALQKLNQLIKSAVEKNAA